MKIVTATAMRELDRRTIDGGYVSGRELMKRAGEACADEILDFVEGLPKKSCRRIIILCGKGNNGGDGYVIAKALDEESNLEITVLNLFEPESFSSDSAYHFEQIPKSVKLVKDWQLSHGDCVIDCLLGTGTKGGLREPYLSIVRELSEIHLPTVAIDICSGVNGDDGSIENLAVEADLTICIGLPKSGNVYGQGGEVSGLLRCVDIGFPKDLEAELSSEGELFMEENTLALRKRPSASSHKYSKGTVFVVGGSDCYSGAPLLAVEAAMRSGAGMGKVLMPSYTGDLPRRSLATVQIPYITDKGVLDESAFSLFKEHWKDGASLVIGPGMKGVEEEKALFLELLEIDADLVIDAGALGFVAEFQDQLSHHCATVVLTPHEGELKKLMFELYGHKNIDDLSVKELSQDLDAIIVKKGRLTRVFSPEGKLSINSSGSIALATAGTGDILAGMVGSSLNHKKMSPYQAVNLAVYQHGTLSLNTAIADDFL